MPKARFNAFVYCAVLVLIAFLIFHFRGTIAATLAENLAATALVYCLTVFQVFLQATNFNALLPASAPQIGWLRTVRTWALGGLANFVAPFQAGIGVRMAVFARDGLTLKESGQTIARQAHLMVWAAVGVLGIGGVILNGRLSLVGFAALGIFVAWPLLLAATRRLAARTSVFKRRPALFADLAWTLSLPRPRHLWNPVAQLVLVALSLWVVYRDLGAPLAVAEALLLGSVTTLSGAIAVTPNNLGILDGILAIAASLKGLDAGEAVALALIYRIAQIGANATLLLIPPSLRRP